MKPYSSKDLRIRVLAAKRTAASTPREEVAKTFSVSVPSIKRATRKGWP
jgi:hypothetical protein